MDLSDSCSSQTCRSMPRDLVSLLCMQRFTTTLLHQQTNRKKKQRGTLCGIHCQTFTVEKSPCTRRDELDHQRGTTQHESRGLARGRAARPVSACRPRVKGLVEHVLESHHQDLAVQHQRMEAGRQIRDSIEGNRLPQRYGVRFTRPSELKRTIHLHCSL